MACKKFLEPFQEGRPPFLLSDGFPLGMFPKPLSSDFDVLDSTRRKLLRKITFISQDDFDDARVGKEIKTVEYDNPVSTFLTAHNSIDRSTNGVSLEGGVYSLRETFIPFVTVYLKTIS